MCVEIAEGRDLDVLEIDAATHTGVDNVRDVIIDGLAIRPVRDRYKIFIIDEVHQLSNSSFNALLKSMEEPPPHVVFMMATTELHKIPDTILSRAQVYEFRTISTRGIIDQLRKIADAEQITVTDEALALVARAADGSMRDAESAFDQVLAFGGDRIDVEHVSTVLGLVGRDLLLDIVDTVAREDAAAVFDLAARVVESGQDLKHVCRDLARLVRDLMILQIDPARTQDPEYAVEGDRARLDALATQFSREDLLRAFDLIAKLETDLRTATQPRYHLEMALLRWIHLRRLLPLTELLGAAGAGPTAGSGAAAGAGAGSSAGIRPTLTSTSPPAPASSSATRPAASPAAAFSSATASLVSKVEARTSASPVKPAASPAAPTPAASPTPTTSSAPSKPAGPPPALSVPPAPAMPHPAASSHTATPAQPLPARSAPTETAPRGLFTPGFSDAAIDTFREAFLGEVKRVKGKLFYNTIVMSARRIDVSEGRVTFVFGQRPATLAANFDQQRAALQEIATAIAGRPMEVAAAEEREAPPAPSQEAAAPTTQDRLKASVMKEPAVQAMLDVFPAEIRDVEEM
jgi:DNA polymerase-3 subunit gamma/tau